MGKKKEPSKKDTKGKSKKKGKPYQLKPLKGGKSKVKRFCVIDIETKNWTQFLCIGLYDGENYRSFKSLKAWWKYYRERYEDYVCYAHFGGIFDFLFLLGFFIIDERLMPSSLIPRGSGLLSFDLEFDHPHRKRPIKFNFSDSSALLPFGLKSLTDNFDVPVKKGTWDHTKTTHASKELLEYMESDCKGLYQVIEKFADWPLIKRAGRTSTIAGQAMKVFRLFLKEPLHSISSKEVDNFVREGYFGGRTEIFKPLFPGGKGKKLYYFDVNSLYPTVMKKYDMPDKFIGYFREYDPKSLGFWRCRVEVPEDIKIPCLGKRIDGKFIFPVGKITGVWTTLELNLAKKHGCKVYVEYGAKFTNAGKIFEEYVDDLYSIRKKAEPLSVDDVLCKLLLNALYGRFGLNCEKENLSFDSGQEGFIPTREFKYKGVPLRIGKIPVTLDTWTNPAIAAWVTSCARVHMMKTCYLECADELYYTDTDSIFTTKKFKTGKKLGELKDEDEGGFEQACFLLPKTYFVQKKKSDPMKKLIKMKGFDKKKITHFTYEDFTTALEGDMRRFKIVGDERIATLKTALQKGKFLAVIRQKKSLQKRYDKRIICKTTEGDYYTRPLSMDEW